MSWDWKIVFCVFGWAVLRPNFKDYPLKKERLAIGRRDGNCWGV